MKDRLPFIATIINDVIVFIAVALFLQDYLLEMALVMVGAWLILRLNSWALVASVLIGIAVELFQKGAVNELRIVALVLVVGSFIELIKALVPHVVNGVRTSKPSVMQNAVFAVIGIALSIVAAFALCDPVPPLASQDAFSGFLYQYGQCVARLAAGRYSDLQFSEVQGLALYHIIVVTFFRLFLMLPTTWAAFFAALRVVNFNLLAPRQLLAQTFRAYLGLLFGGGMVAAIVQTPIVLVSFALGNIGASNEFAAWTEGLFALSLGIGLFAFAWGAGWGARWGLRTK